MASTSKTRPTGQSKTRTGSPRVGVTLTARDWRDLVNFVVGDLDNMPADDEICIQMRRICDTIETRFLTTELKARRAENNPPDRREACGPGTGSTR